MLRLVFTSDGVGFGVGVVSGVGRELMTLEIKQYRSRKRSHKRDGIGVRRSLTNRNVSISSDSVYDSVAYVPLMN